MGNMSIACVVILVNSSEGPNNLFLAKNRANNHLIKVGFQKQGRASVSPSSHVKCKVIFMIRSSSETG